MEMKKEITPWQDKYYLLGKTLLHIKFYNEMRVPENIHIFEVTADTETSGSTVEYEVFVEDNLIPWSNAVLEQQPKLLYQNYNINVFKTEAGESRMIYFDQYARQPPYAISIQTGPTSYEIYYAKPAMEMMQFDPTFWAPFCLERIMDADNAMILHSAYMCLNNEAVLFSAPSGTGKSTQAGLWEKYRGTYQVNGDRSLLIKEEDGWYAYSWPICGSSEICLNEKHKVKALVMLSQAKENKVYKMGGGSAFMEIMAQITVNSWNREFQMRVMDRIEDLIAGVPVFKQECDISEEAVERLEGMLEERLE